MFYTFLFHLFCLFINIFVLTIANLTLSTDQNEAENPEIEGKTELFMMAVKKYPFSVVVIIILVVSSYFVCCLCKFHTVLIGRN